MQHELVSAAVGGELDKLQRLAPAVLREKSGLSLWALRFALTFASKHGHLQVVEFLLQEVYTKNIFCDDEDAGELWHPLRPLSMAAQAGHADVLAALLKYPLKEDIDTPIIHSYSSPDPTSALQLAVANGNSACVLLLLKAGADIPTALPECEDEITMGILEEVWNIYVHMAEMFSGLRATRACLG